MTPDQLLDALAALTINLYRATMVAGGSNEYGRQLRADIQNPKTGDLVMDVSGWPREPADCIAWLEFVWRCEHSNGECDRIPHCFVRRLDGRYEVWRNVRLIKVSRFPFAAITESKSTGGANGHVS